MRRADSFSTSKRNESVFPIKSYAFFNFRYSPVLIKCKLNISFCYTVTLLHFVLRYLKTKTENYFTHENHDKKRTPDLHIQSILDFRFITYRFLWHTTVSTLPLWGFGRPVTWCRFYGLYTVFHLFSDRQCAQIHSFLGTSSLYGLSFFKYYTYLSKLYCMYGCNACTALLGSFYYQLYVSFIRTFGLVSFICTLAQIFKKTLILVRP